MDLQMPQQYTPEQIKDIQEREAKALAYLAELQLTPSAQLSMENMNRTDVFGIRCQPYLQDTKYAPVASPYEKV